MGITRAKKRLFLSHARTRALYNTRNANELSRFVSEIPQRLIMDGTGRMDARRVPPPTAGRGESRWAQPPRSPYGQTRQPSFADKIPQSPFGSKTSTGSAELDRKLGIAGVQKGFGTNVRAAAPPTVFKIGDKVRHRVFGSGTIVAVTGEGNAQRVKIRFGDGSERTFSASAAPITKIE